MLRCELVSTLAKKRLISLWSPTSTSDKPPSAASQRPPYRESLTCLALARELKVPVVVKRALYELTASVGFWEDVCGAKRGEVDITDADLVVLLRARAALQEQWRTQVLMPPGSCRGTPACARDGSQSLRCMAETKDSFRPH